MIDNPFEMVVLIVLIVSIASVIRARFTRPPHRRQATGSDAEAGRLKDEVRTLKERVAVLERIATDKNHLLESEFERLRDER